jgi:hypothetical protein
MRYRVQHNVDQDVEAFGHAPQFGPDPELGGELREFGRLFGPHNEGFVIEADGLEHARRIVDQDYHRDPASVVITPTEQAPTIHGFTVGALVVCTHRMPSRWQPWLHDIYVGRVELPGTNPAAWNGHNSELDYCISTGRIPVTYGSFRQHDPPGGSFRQHDPLGTLIPITAEQAELPHEEKVALFLGPEARARLGGGRELETAVDRTPTGQPARAALRPSGLMRAFDPPNPELAEEVIDHDL